MKTSWRYELPQLALIAAMFVAAALSWSHLPDRIPVHWGLHGEVDHYGGRFEGLLVVPLTVLGVYVLMLVMPLIDPGRANYRNFGRAYNVVRVSLVLVLSVIYFVILAAAFGHHLDVPMIGTLSLAALFLVLGNFMGKIRPNWFIGVRTPWTLSSKLSWNKTHRLAGWLMTAMGVLFVIAAIVATTWVFISVFALLGLCIVWMVIYSYLVYRQDPHRAPPAGTSPGTE